jgi:hypothetical protein
LVVFAFDMLHRDGRDAACRKWCEVHEPLTPSYFVTFRPGAWRSE